MNDIPLQDIYTFFTELLGLVYLFYRYFIGSDPRVPKTATFLEKAKNTDPTRS